MESGVLGLGFGNDDTNGTGGTTHYNSLLDNLYLQGHIAHKDFSVAVGSRDTNDTARAGKKHARLNLSPTYRAKRLTRQQESSFLAVSTCQSSRDPCTVSPSSIHCRAIRIGKIHHLYSPPFPFSPLPVIKLTLDDLQRYWVNLTTFTIDMCAKAVGWNFASGQYALLDSGSTLSYLPGHVVTAIAEYFEEAALTWNETLGLYEIDCDASASGETSFSFGFGLEEVLGGVYEPVFDIAVSMRDLIWVQEPEISGENEAKCFLGVTESQNDQVILGDSFMRSVVGEYSHPLPLTYP